MAYRQRAMRVGAALILWAALLRLAEGLPPAVRVLAQYSQRSETGQSVRFSASSPRDHARESPAPVPPEPVLPERPRFSREDAGLVALYNTSGREPDIPALLEAPLSWDLTGPEPSVLILHTHTTESYTKEGEDYPELSPWRTLEEGYNMLCIGDAVVRRLAEAGITAVHDRQVHDYPSYSGSYNHARKSLEALLAENPTVRLVLDLHRDASGTGSTQLRPRVALPEGTCAGLMIVVGAGSENLPQDRWQENLALGVKLHAWLEKRNGGIMRPLSLRDQRFNQDLSPGMLLVEVGAAGNTLPEARLAAQKLADAIIALARGTKPAAPG